MKWVLGGVGVYLLLVHLRNTAWGTVASSCNTQFPAGWATTPADVGQHTPNCPDAVAFNSKWGWLPVPHIEL